MVTAREVLTEEIEERATVQSVASTWLTKRGDEGSFYGPSDGEEAMREVLVTIRLGTEYQQILASA